MDLRGAYFAHRSEIGKMVWIGSDPYFDAEGQIQYHRKLPAIVTAIPAPEEFWATLRLRDGQKESDFAVVKNVILTAG